MHEFHYKDGILYCEDIPLPDIVEKYPTPFYLYRYNTVMDHFLKIRDAFKEVDPLISKQGVLLRR
jgi:diaminopimelate decarboxylase